MDLSGWAIRNKSFIIKLFNLSSTYGHLVTFVRYGYWDFFNDLVVEINTSCNRRCSYCPNSISDRGLIENENIMPTDLYHNLIDELAEIGFRGRLSPHLYGEPLLKKNLTSLMKYTRTKLPKAKIVIFSNGDALSIHIFNELIDAGVDNFLITHHGKSISENMQLLLNYIQRHPKKSKHLKCIQLGPKTPLYNRGGSMKPKIVNTIPRCSYPSNPVSIDYNGNVILCCNDYFSSVKFGNIKEHTLLDIWLSDRYRAMRKQLRKEQYSLPMCLRCTGNSESEQQKENDT